MRFLLPNLLRTRPNLHPGPICGALLATLILAGCGGISSNTGSGASGTTTVTVLITSTANDQIANYFTTLNSLTLTSQTGTTAYLIVNPINAEFLQVNGTTEPLLTVTVPQGVYTAATVSVGESSFDCMDLDPSYGFMGSEKFDYGYTPQSHVTISLPTPIAIAGDNAKVLLNLQVSQSATYNKENCALTTNPWSITPTFTLTLARNENPMHAGLKGLIGAAAASGGRFTVIAADGNQICGSSGCEFLASDAVWQVATDANTVYQGIGGFSGLVAGVPVDMDATLQPDGSLLAKRIAVYDTDPSNLSVTIGPVTFVWPGLSAFYNNPNEQFSPQTKGMWPLSFGNAAFHISGQFSNVSSLPFPASFSAANLVAGQNILGTTHHLNLKPPAPSFLPAATITLIPQTIDGTVSAIGSAGGFTTYTVTLAPYDLFPSAAVQKYQTTVLTNPNTVVVYADSNTQMLNTNPITVGSVVRFYGLVFNDDGTLRMDCAQINDGVAE
jgi:hypothetical protein